MSMDSASDVHFPKGGTEHQVEYHGQNHVSTAPVGMETRGFALQRTDDDEEPTLHFRTILTIASLCFAAYGINVGVTGTGFYLSFVTQTLGPSPISLFFAESWLISQVGITPIVGLMSDFGAPTRKWLCVGLMMLSVVGLAVAGSAHNWHVGIVGITLFGPAVSTYGPQASIASDVVPRRMRGFVQGILYSAQAFGSITAAVGGGAMIQNKVGGDGWRWIMYLGAIMLAVSALGIAVCYQPIPHPELHEKPYLQRLAGLDWTGTVLFSCGMVPFLLGVIWGGNKYPWKSAAPITSIALGGLFFIIFGCHQAFIRKDGVFNHRLFKNRNFPISLMTIFVEGIVYITLNVFLGQQVTLYESRPVFIGLHFATLLFCASLSASAWGYYSHKTKEMKFPLILGYFLFMCACIGFSQVTSAAKSDKLIYGMCAIVGIGFGPPLALILAVAQLAVDPDLTGIASSLVIGIRSWGGVTGASIASAIFTAKITKYLPEKVAAAAIGAGVPPADVGAVIGYLTAAAGSVPVPAGVTPAQLGAAGLGLREAYVSSFKYIYYEMIPWAVFAMILLCFLRPTSETMTWSITTPAETYDALGVHRSVAVKDEVPTPSVEEKA